MAKKIYGTTGRILKVDLSNGKLWEEDVDEGVLREYLGGTGLGVKFLYDEVNPNLVGIVRITSSISDLDL